MTGHLRWGGKSAHVLNRMCKFHVEERLVEECSTRKDFLQDFALNLLPGFFLFHPDFPCVFASVSSLRFFLFSFVSRPSKAAGNPVMNHASILGLTRMATSFFCIFLFCEVGMYLAGEQKSCQGPGKYRKKFLDFFGAPLFVSP